MIFFLKKGNKLRVKKGKSEERKKMLAWRFISWISWTELTSRASETKL